MRRPTLNAKLLYWVRWRVLFGREPTSGLENRWPLLITNELFLLAEQPASHFLGLRSVYWTATKVKVGTTCVRVLSNSRKFETPTSRVMMPITCMAHLFGELCAHESADASADEHGDDVYGGS